MRSVCIGIHLQSEPERLRLTLASLKRNTCAPIELLLLADGPDVSTRNFLATLDLRQSGTQEAVGAPACFNRLVSSTDAEVVVFLESGAQTGPGWLAHLLQAFDSNPHNGLAGPSTNYAWNEQGVFPHAGNTSDEIASNAAEAARRFDGDIRTLEPLHSLADFCYAVRREVIDEIGAADENYSLGPCWEMDYNIRAARAGWRAVWVGAAYVHRAPFTAQRRFQEAQRFITNKHLYQSKFCGARLRGEKLTFRDHCRGDACVNFAPAALIEIKRSLVAPPIEVEPAPATQHVSVSERLVTCIMPTFNRRAFVPQAIRCFLRQDYPNLELLVVDDGTDKIADCVPQNERIRYLHLDRKLTIGAKRNLACEQARGEFIVHWDDDDWYPTWRVSAQVKALTRQGADLSGTSRVYYYDVHKDETWQYRYQNSNSQWVAGNTLAYRKSFWARNNFPDVQVGEDSRFVWSSASKQIWDLNEPGLCVATAHPQNTSQKNTSGCYWHAEARETLLSLLGDDVYFYRSALISELAEVPLVSCIMPTFNRRAYLPQAIHSFLQQDYKNRELIVIDDGSDAIRDLLPDLPGIRYLRVPRISIGAKRNLACQHARGQVIAHWDDDDWYAPDRLRYQVAPILLGLADMTGLENAFVLDLPSAEFWATQPDLHQRLFVGNVHGGTLVYRKEIWSAGLRYPEVNLAEDASLLYQAMGLGRRLLRLANPGVFVYVRHGRNAWRDFAPGSFIDPQGWQRITPPPNFPDSVLEFYRSACGQN
jgi:glycosyltransferase involved in cell wall biosynthesis